MPEIKRLVDTYAGRILLENLVTLYEAVQEFWVADLDGEVVGCGALHVLWSDLGEVRTVAVDPRSKVEASAIRSSTDCSKSPRSAVAATVRLDLRDGLLRPPRVRRDRGHPVTAEVYEEMCRSYDIGVAEFLDLSYVKPNILGNTRMLLVL